MSFEVEHRKIKTVVTIVITIVRKGTRVLNQEMCYFECVTIITALRSKLSDHECIPEAKALKHVTSHTHID